MSWEDPSDELSDLVPRLVEVRHDLHRHPELGFEEHRTQGVVEKWLAEFGYETRRCAGTGVVADLHGPKSSGRTVALRADLDCLPMPETTDLPYRSVHEGRAHKCGHDGHTAILLGMAALAARHRDRIGGNLRLIFQPAEEGVRGGGARVMVEEGVLKGVDEIYGLHNWPDFPLGELHVKDGPMMAQVHQFSVDVRGKGGHGSQPQQCRDPIMAGAALVNNLQTIASRAIASDQSAILSVCTFQAGTADNVIPGRATLSGTIRTFDPAVTERVLQRLEQIVEGTAVSHEVEIELELTRGFPVLVNDPDCVEVVRRVGRANEKIERVAADRLPITGGEDFSYFSAEVPGAYFLLGTGREGEQVPGCHHPDFDFEDRLIPLAIELLHGIVRERCRD
jgi:amidohydrolase